MAEVFFITRQRTVLVIKHKRKVGFTWLCALALVFQIFAAARPVSSQGVTGAIKGTVSATAGDPSASPELLPGARLTLVNRDLPATAFNAVTAETVNFIFRDLP